MVETPPRRGAGDRNLSAALALLNRLQPALHRHDRAALVDIVQQLAGLRAPLGEQWVQLAEMAAKFGEPMLARRALELHVELAPDDPAAPFRQAAVLSSIGQWEQAYRALDAVPEDVPDRAAHACLRGTAASLLGKAEEARARLGEAVRLRPLWGSAWLALATLVDFAHEPALAAQVIGGARQVSAAPPREQGPYLYAAGKARADVGEHAEAFAAFAEGARITRGQLAYSREQDAKVAAQALDGYDAARIAALAREQERATERTIFVMGLPRSGTTLVEQILTSHSEVSFGGEINRLPLWVMDSGGQGWAALRGYADRVGAPAAADLWHHWLDQLAPGGGRVVDKSFTTPRMLGLAAALLPDAPLVWLTRDPLDCAWSCFRTHFASGAPWSYDLEDLAFHFRLEDELLARWREILGERLLVVPYEALVTQPDLWIRKLLTHCGLGEEPQVFAPHANPRAVATASAIQVRRPISRSAIGAAEPYREYLAPFAEAYFG